MKTKHIMAIGALGSTLAIVPFCASVSAVTNEPTTWEAPAVPTSIVWDGSEYVGEVDGILYYKDPDGSWLALDTTRQQHFDAWLKNQSAGNNSGEQTNQTGSTRSQGAARGLNASEQSGQIQNTGYQGQGAEMGQGPNWNNPGAEPNGIRNTRYEGHDMGQTHPVAPPLPAE